VTYSVIEELLASKGIRQAWFTHDPGRFELVVTTREHVPYAIREWVEDQIRSRIGRGVDMIPHRWRSIEPWKPERSSKKMRMARRVHGYG
jgi:hypothetical protein